MILDAYIPTRTTSGFEVRVITDTAGAITLSSYGTPVVLKAPDISHNGCCFYRHRFTELPPDRGWFVEVTQQGAPNSRQLKASTQPEAKGRHLLRFGIHADCHLGPAGMGEPRGKRLYAVSEELNRKYLQATAAAGAEFIILPGDVTDPATSANLALMQKLCASTGIPCFPLIGNHEGWGGSEQAFYRAAGLPPEGYLALSKADTRFLFLSTPAQDSLDPGTRQLHWLEEQLTDSREQNILLFSHFAFILHPCVQGYKNDGMQIMDNHRQLHDLLAGCPRVKACFAGHKNVPSRVMVNGVAHQLCPQLIQAPCSYLLIDLYEDGLRQTIFEIEEQHWLHISRLACGAHWPERYGDEDSRNYFFSFH